MNTEALRMTPKPLHAFQYPELRRVAIQYLTLDPKEGLQLPYSFRHRDTIYCMLLYYILLKTLMKGVIV